jgi:endonuclease YncB( thermonuclease family)
LVVKLKPRPGFLPRSALLAATVFPLGCVPANADELIGRASVIDGDTVEIHGEHVRIFGIDARERSHLH